MKLIVDVLESDYEVIINHCDDYVKSLYNEPEERCILAVKNGIPLDKHDEEIIATTVESIWGKPPYTELLDKIRAEIRQAADKQFQIAMGIADLNERYTHIQMENAYRHSLNIVDKYTAEVKPQESEE